MNPPDATRGTAARRILALLGAAIIAAGLLASLFVPAGPATAFTIGTLA